MARVWIKENRLYFIVIMLLIYLMAVRTPLDTDMWWHLQAGQATWESGHVYQVDTFSSTRAGVTWINHSWLSQLLMYAILRIGNFPGLSIWVALSAVVSMGLVYAQMKGHPLLRAGILLLAGIVASVVWSPRPQVMSLVLLALLTWVVDRYWMTQNTTYLFSLPPLFVLWANLHGGYVLGLIYLGTFLAGAFLDLLLGQASTKGRSSRSALLLLAAAAVSCLAVLLNPFGTRIWLIPFNTVGVQTLQDLINEWASPDFHQAFQQPFLVMLLGLMAALGFSDLRARGRKLIPVLVFAAAGLVARRNFGPFAIVAAPVLAEHSAAVLKSWAGIIRSRWLRFDRFLSETERNKRDFNPAARNLINLILVGLLLFAGAVKTVEVNQAGFLSEKEAAMFPAGAAAWLQEYEHPLHLFNDYNWGGYLIYRLAGVPVFVDGRTDLFGDEVLQDYVSIMEVEPEWEMILEGYGIDTLLIPRDSLLASAAGESGWMILYQDDVSVVFRKD